MAGAAALLAGVAAPRLALADKATAGAVIRGEFGDRPRQRGRIAIDLPKLAETGNSVPLKIAVDSPMTDADHVRRVMVVAEENPRPRVIDAYFTPASGRAAFSTRIRLNGDQRVLVFAEMSDGSLWTEETEVRVTVGACEPPMITFGRSR